MSFRDDTKRMSDLFVEVRDAKPPQRSKNSAGEGVHADHAQATISGSYSRFSMNSVLSCVSFASPKAYEGPIPRSIEALNRLAMPQMQTCCPNAYVLPKCKRYRRRASAARDSGTLRRPFSHPISISTGASFGRCRHLRSPRQASVGFHFRCCPFAVLGPCS